MNIRGLQKFSLIDYPGRLTCVVFSGNCNFRCPFCHNPCLIFDPESQPRILERELLDFLEKRRGKLDGVVFSGGEPMMQLDLCDFADSVKQLGFNVKVDTNGSFPQMIEKMHCAGVLDALGIDCKGPFADYARHSGNDMEGIAEAVQESIVYAARHHIELDIRTTVHRSLLSVCDLRRMNEELRLLGITAWTLQQFHYAEVIDSDLGLVSTYSDSELLSIAHEIGPHVSVRGILGK